MIICKPDIYNDRSDLEQGQNISYFLNYTYKFYIIILLHKLHI